MLSNWRVKILVVIFSTIFWFFIVSSVDQVRTFNQDLKIVPLDLAQNLTILKRDSLPRVKIYYKPISDTNFNYRNLTVDDFSVTIQLKGLGIGETTIPINVQANHPDIEIVDYIPKEVTLKLEDKITKEFPVETQIIGQPRNGYKVNKTTNPVEIINLTGAKSTIERIDKVNAVIELYGAESTDQQKQAKISLTDIEGAEVSSNNIEMSPNNINIYLEIRPDEETKTVGIIPNLQKISLQNGYFIKSVRIDPPTATIKGKSNDIKDIEYLDTIRLTINDLDSNYKTDLDVSVPQNITITSPENGQVTLSLEVASLDYQRQIEAKLSIRNLPKYLQYENKTPVLATMTGPPSDLDQIDENDVSISIDYNDIGKEGMYRHDLSKSDFIYPQNLTLLEYTPKIIEVLISRR